jgi:hypothetical protein
MSMDPHSSQTMILGFFGLLTTIVTSAAAILIARINVKQRAVVAATQETASSVKEIHHAVNSEREKMVAKLSDMHAEILRLSVIIATQKPG